MAVERDPTPADFLNRRFDPFSGEWAVPPDAPTLSEDRVREVVREEIAVWEARTAAAVTEAVRRSLGLPFVGG